MGENTNEPSAFKYILIASFCILAGRILGTLTNNAVNYITNLTGLKKSAEDADKLMAVDYVTIIIQTLIVAIVIYIFRIASKYINYTPLEEFSYGMIIITMYISSQANFHRLSTRVVAEIPVTFYNNISPLLI